MRNYNLIEAVHLVFLSLFLISLKSPISNHDECRVVKIVQVVPKIRVSMDKRQMKNNSINFKQNLQRWETGKLLKHKQNSSKTKLFHHLYLVLELSYIDHNLNHAEIPNVNCRIAWFRKGMSIPGDTCVISPLDVEL